MVATSVNIHPGVEQHAPARDQAPLMALAPVGCFSWDNGINGRIVHITLW